MANLCTIFINFQYTTKCECQFSNLYLLYSSSDMENTEIKKEVMDVNSDLEIFNDQKKKKKRKHKHHKHKRDKVLEKEDIKIDKQDR